MKLLEFAIDPFREAFSEVRGYDISKLRRDGVAGATVAAVAVPQAMAYAIIAGVPAEYGLYTLVFQCLIGSLLNSQPLLSGGPINSQSLLVASITTRAVGPGDGENLPIYLGFVLALTLTKGLIQVALAAGRAGSLVRFVSRSVVAGFTAGAGVLIAAGQIDAFLGYRKAAPDFENTPYLLTFGVQSTLLRTGQTIGEASWRAAVLGLVAVLIVLVGRRLGKFVPGPLIAVVGCGALVWGLGWLAEPFTKIPALPRGLPSPTLPRVAGDQLGALVLGAAALAMMGLMEAYSIGKAIAVKRGGRIDANRELFGQGLTHVATSFLNSIPGSGSFSRSALNEQAGAATAFSGIFNALLVLGIFLLAAPLAVYVPMSAIAAILFVVAWGLIDLGFLRQTLTANWDDSAVFVATMAATLFLPLKYAVFIGIGLNLILQLRRSATLHASRLVPTADGHFRELDDDDDRRDESIAILQLDGDLFFATADELETELDNLTIENHDAIILRLRRVHHVDVTVLTVLKSFIDRSRAVGTDVWLCGVDDDLRPSLQALGVADALGEGRLIPQRDGLMVGLREAVAAARGQAEIASRTGAGVASSVST